MADYPATSGTSLITLPHQVEFLSDVWLAEAAAFFREQVALRQDRLGGRPFSVSERFTDAPPHLKLPGNVAAWSLRYDDWFDKMTATGRDYVRLEHMRQLHGFTRSKMAEIRG